MTDWMFWCGQATDSGRHRVIASHQAFVGLPLPRGFLLCRQRRHAPCQYGFDFAAVVVIDVDREPFIRRFPEVATGFDIEHLGDEASDDGDVLWP